MVSQLGNRGIDVVVEGFFIYLGLVAWILR